MATKAQTTFGPNRYALELGKSGIAKAHVLNLNPGLIFGSADPVAAESFALALLKDTVKSVPLLPKLFQYLLLFSNRNILELDKIRVQNHPYIRHAVNIELGKLPDQIRYNNVPNAIQTRLNEYIIA